MSYLPGPVQLIVDEAVSRRVPDSVLELAPSPCLDQVDWPQTRIRRQPLAVDFTLRCLDTTPASLALVVDAPRALTRVGVEQLLAYLGNAGAAAVLAVFAIDPVAQASAWRQSDFLALGFRRAEGTRIRAPDHLIYRYDIHDYKITPNWLNAGYWANPNRWDHERW